MSGDLSYPQAIIIGALQGVTELFPISSLGHSVLVPALFGGNWTTLVTQSSTAASESSPYLAFIVALHVATAAALLVFYWRDWVRIITALVVSVRTRQVTTPTQRLAWLIVVATIPVGLTGLLLEHTFRTLFAKPLAAAIFLVVNGGILLAGERLRRTAERRTAARAAVTAGVGAAPAAGYQGTAGDTPGPTTRGGSHDGGGTHDGGTHDGGTHDGGTRGGALVVREHRSLDRFGYREAAIIGAFQTLALLAGISRSGVTMVAGLLRGLDHEDAAKFAFLLATPVIFAAGVLKIPSLFGPGGAGIHGQVLAGALTAGVAAYASVRFLTRYFSTRTLTPFALYCLAFGGFCVAWFA